MTRFVIRIDKPALKHMSSERTAFLRLVAIFQGGLLIASIGIGWILGHQPLSQCFWSVDAVLLGIVATIPMLLFLGAAYQSRFRNLVQIRKIVSDLLGRQLAACTWIDLIAVALLAGFSEEFLFRGVIEPLFKQWWSPVVALILCNIVFGFCHAVSPSYFVFAALLGGYLSLTLWITSVPNLVIPTISHALYDFVAFVIVRNTYLNEVPDLPNPDDELATTTPLDSTSSLGRD